MQTASGKVFETIAYSIRKIMDKEQGRGWNVVVGSHFGAFVTHEIKTYMYFSLPDLAPGTCVLVWRG